MVVSHSRMHHRLTFSSRALIGSPPLQNPCTKSLEVTRMSRTLFMTATIKVRRRGAKRHVFSADWFLTTIGCLYTSYIQTRLTKHWKNEPRRILIIRIVLTRLCLYNTLRISRKDCPWKYLPMISQHTLGQRLRKNTLHERLF